MSGIKAFAPAVLIGLGVLLVSGIREQHIVPPARPVDELPTKILQYTSRDILVPEQEQKIAGMSHYSMREFTQADSTLPFSVYVGYYDRQVQGKTIHSPKNCLPGAGWDILISERVALPGGGSTGTANRVLLSNQGTRALVYYWYQGRGRRESSEYKVKWDLLRDAALYGRTEEALVRIVVPVGRDSGRKLADDPALKSADALVAKVITTLAPELDRVLPKAPA